jgi:phosphoglycerate kinase
MTINFKNKRALIRVDFNVPLDAQFNVTDNSRILAALPTIKKVLADGGSAVLMSHLGRPKEGPTDKYSLKHLLPELNKVLGTHVKFVDDCISDESFKVSGDLKPGEVLLLENLRFYKQEEKGDVQFAEKLAKHGDVYVNDAFGTAHRAHASTAIIAQ